MMRPKFIRARLKKWRRVLHECEDGWGFKFWQTTPASFVLGDQDSYHIPRDVPKGHLAVYVGEDEKRYVIRVSVLNHPLFRGLLDEASEVYDYSGESTSRLRIPCDENVSVEIMRCTARRRRNVCGVCLFRMALLRL